MILISTSSEVAQGMISSRIFDPTDIWYNLIGSSLGLGISVLLEKVKPHHENQYIPLQELQNANI
jgi:glycopeptide antibiotics resistance protein